MILKPNSTGKKVVKSNHRETKWSRKFNHSFVEMKHKRLLDVILFLQLFGVLNRVPFPIFIEGKTFFNFTDVQSLRFTKPPTDARFFNTRRTKIECKASGIPRPSISWETVDGKTVGNITGIRSVDYDGSLEFHAFEPKNFNAVVHNAKYRCIATNALGRLRSATINVNAGIASFSLFQFAFQFYFYFLVSSLSTIFHEFLLRIRCEGVAIPRPYSLVWQERELHSTIEWRIDWMPNSFSVIDKVHSPKVFLQRSFPGGSAVFECMLATDAANHISLVSWTLRWPKTGNVVQLGSGGSKERFHVPQGLRHLVIRSVKNQDNFMRVSCKIKDTLNQVILKSSEAFLFVEGKFQYATFRIVAKMRWGRDGAQWEMYSFHTVSFLQEYFASNFIWAFTFV